MANKMNRAISHVDKINPLQDLVPLEYGFEDCSINNWEMNRSAHSRYMLFFVKRGSGTFKIGDKSYTVGENQGFLLKPYEKCFYAPDKKNPWYYAHICFTGAFAFKFNYLTRVFSFPSALFDEFIEICLKDDMVDFYLSSFLFKLCATYSLGSSVTPDLNTLHFNAAMLYINHHFTGDITVEKVSKHMKLNKRYLARVFKSVSGKSIREVLLKKRLELAMTLLTNGENVTSVAEKAGYNDPPSFSKAFSNFYGISPSKVKTKKRKNEQ